MEPLGLISISLCNSYIHGKIVDIHVDDHTNLSGGNGKGKTSALQLTPCFYGHSPEKLVSTAAGKSSFIDFYLPFLSSMIVFHYRRADGDRTVVMLRHPSRKIIYRFISVSPLDSIFQSEWMEKIKAGHSAHDLLNDLKVSSDLFNVSRIIENIVDYRSIIQNDRKLRQNRSKSPFVTLAWEYSLGGTDASGVCQDMDYLTYAILKRSDMIDRLKMMIINTQFDCVVPTLPHHDDDNSLISDIRSIRDFEESKVKRIQQAIDRYHALKVDRKDIQGYQSFLSTALPQIQELRDNIHTEQSRLEDSYRSFFATTNQEMADLEHTEEKTQHRVKRFDKDIEDLLGQQQAWFDQDITAKETQVEQLESSRDAVVAARAYLNSLSDEQGTIEEWKHQQVQSVESRSEKSEGVVNLKISSRKEEKKKLDASRERKINEIEAKLNATLDSFKDEYYENKSNLKVERSRVNTLISTAAPTPEESHREEQTQSDFHDRKKECDRAKSRYEAQQAEVKKYESEFTRLHEAFSQAQEITQQQEKRIEAIKHTLFPVKNSLLSHLRGNNPEWVNDIGRIIQPEILSRTDLSPTTDQLLIADKSLYGVSIDLEQLQPVDAARGEDVIRNELAFAEEKLVELQDEEEKLASAATGLEKKIKSLKRDLVRLEAECNRAEQRKISAQDAIEFVKADIKAAIAQRDETYRQELEEYENELKDLSLSYQSTIQNTKELAQAEKDEFISLIASKISLIDEKISALKSQLTSIIEDKEASLKQIDHHYKIRCKEAGVDDEALKSARASLDEKEARVLLIEGYQEIITEYKVWFRNEWSQYEAWVNELASLNQKLSNTQSRIKKLSSTQKSRTDIYQATRQKLIRKLKKHNDHLKVIADVLEQVPVDANSRVEQPPGLRLDNIDNIVVDLEALIGRYKKSRRELINNTRDIHSMILNRSGSQLTEYWVNRSQELLAKMQLANNDLSEDSEGYLLELAPNLEELVERQLPSLRSALITSTELAMTRILDYIQNLQLIDTETKRVTSRLHSKLNVGQRIPALTDIQIVLSSRIHELDGWNDFERFKRIYEKHHNPHVRGLPSAELERELENILVITRAATKKQELKNLIIMTLAMKENGRSIEIRNDKDFNNASSNGLSYLAVIVIFRALARYLCPDERIRLTWPIDEIGTLDASNLSLLFDMLRESNITMIGAVPTTDPVTLRHFKYKWIIDRESGVKAFKSSTKSIDQATNKLRALTKAHTPEAETDIETDEEV